MADCSTCLYWAKIDTEDDEYERGFCRRFPPVIVPNAINPVAFASTSQKGCKVVDNYVGFPETLDEDWCGEYREKEQIE